jgi:4'-phosphopantetheinyl transferase
VDATAKHSEALSALATEVHVYTSRPPESDEGRARELLDADETDRLERFRRRPDRALFLCAHVLVRSVLSRYADVRPADWRFAAGHRGRPEIAGPGRSPLRFNLSHTAGLAACVVTDGWDCGIDVESRNRRRDPLAVADRVTTPAERAVLEALPEALRSQHFLTCWTLKEAYAKARGLGLALPLRHYGFVVDGDAIRIDITDPGHRDAGEGWQFASLRPTPAHTLAVALRRGDDPPRRIVLRPAD